MKSISVYALVVAAVCSTVLVSSVAAGPRHHGRVASGLSQKVPPSIGSSNRGERIFIDPPPGGHGPIKEIMPITITVNGSTNPGKQDIIAPKFSQSILDAGLPKTGGQGTDAQQILTTSDAAIRSTIRPGPGPQGPPTLTLTTPVLSLSTGASPASSPGH